MATEKAIQEGIQTVIRGIAAFDDESVQINRDVFLDGSLDYSPFFNIITADEFGIRQDTVTETGFYEVGAILYVEWEDWETSYNDMRDRRQDIIDTFGAVGTARSAGGIDGVDIPEIRSGGPIVPVTYDDDPDAFPVLLMQLLIFRVDIYG